MIDESALPEGWSLERVRELEPAAELLDLATRVVVADQRSASTQYEVLAPTAILSFAGLCLCLVPEEDGPALWWMGQRDDSDGSIQCWSPYGDDLEHAIRSL